MSKPRDAKKSRREKQQTLPTDPGSSPEPRIDLVLPFAIFLFAFAVRLLYLSQIETIPLFYHLAADGRRYDEWAQQIAAGDWLGQGVFYQAPLYPYFLGLLQAILGHNLWAIRVVQIFLGAASCSLLYWAGRSFFSRRAGIAAGFILSLYAPAIFFEGLIQKTVLDLFLIGLLLLLLSRAQSKPLWIYWGAIGVVVGLLGLARENALIWLFVVPIWIWFCFRERAPSDRARWIAIFLLGSAVVLIPVGARNLKVGGEFTLTTSQFGPNFFIGNNPAAEGTYSPLRAGRSDPKFERQDAMDLAEQALGRSLSPGEVSGYWFRRSWDYISSQPLDWASLTVRKWFLLWNVKELEDADDFYLYQRWSWLLGILARFSHFGLLAPLAAIGIVLTWKHWRRLWLLHALLLTLAFSVALFYVFGRYRFPMVPLLALFAGAGLVEGFALYRERMVRRGLACAALLLLTAVVVHWPVTGRAGPSAAGYSNLGNALVKAGRITEAIESYQQALQVQPNDAVAHYNLGNLFAAQGKDREAMRHYQEAIRIQPDFAEPRNNLGNLLAMGGRLDEAIGQLREALKLSPSQSEVRFNLANALARQGRFDEAREHYQAAIKMRPDFVEARHNLGRVLAAQGHLGEAIDHFREAVRIRPEFAEVHESLAQALAEQGKRGEATRHYQEAVRIKKARPAPPASQEGSR